MPEIVLNCQNLQCPEPVIRVKKCLEAEQPEKITVVADNEAAVENLTRFLSSQGYAVTSALAEPGLWRVTGLRSAAASQPKTAAPSASALKPAIPSDGRKILVFIASAAIGTGDESLGARLMKNFVSTLPEMGADLWRIVFVNQGVTLAVQGSPVLDDLQSLEAGGASILVCGTCLEHYQILAQKAVGQTTNMLDIVTSMQLADSVIRI